MHKDTSEFDTSYFLPVLSVNDGESTPSRRSQSGGFETFVPAQTWYVHSTDNVE